jgi:Domain of unknown function (DU1801)
MEKVKTSPTTHIKSLPAEVRDDVAQLHKIISAELKGLPVVLWEGTFWGGSTQQIIGYGDFVYTGSRAKAVNWFLVGLAVQKNYISIYVNAVERGQYVAEKYKKQLGAVKVGKSSISFKRLADVNVDALRAVLAEAARQASQNLGETVAPSRARRTK